MTVIKGTYANNELQVYRYLTSTMQLNSAAACGVMANIYHESRFDHLAEGDGGDSFGLVQWNKGRKTNLINYCNRLRMSHTTVSGQMSFLYNELKNAYKKSVLDTLTSVPNTSQGAYDAAYKFCTHFEIPANKYERAAERGSLASTSYWSEYGRGVAPLPTGVGFTTDLGSKIVEIARVNIGKPYKIGSYGPDSFNSPGFVYYCYTEAGYSMDRLSSVTMYTYYANIAKPVTPNEVRAGDLLYYKKPNYTDVYHIAIANGEGGRIYSSEAEDEVIEVKSSIGNPTHILRILSDSETSQVYNPVGGYEDAVEDFTALTVRDDYAATIEQNLSRVEAVGFDYGYLIDLTHGGEFRFYIPEFSETAGAQWEDVNIIGRSVSIKAYSHTTSRSITVSLDLYAGVGLYADSKADDIVGKLHKDLNFVKSLEYPDYSNAIVRPPSTVQLILGSSIQLVGVVSDVNVEHMKPVDSQNRSLYAKLSFTVVQTAVNPPDYSDIRNGRYVLTSTSDVSSITQDNDTNAPKFTG